MSEVPSNLQREAARSIVTRYLQVRPGENAIIESWHHTLPMASAMLDEVRRAGGKALLVYGDEDSWWRSIDRKQYKLLGQSSDPEWAALKAADVYVNFWGPSDSVRMEKLPDRADPAFDWLWPWYEVARKVGLRGVRMTTGFVTPQRARQWGLNQQKWDESLLRASLVDPEQMAKSGARLANRFHRGKRVRVTHPNGTDVEVGLAGAAPRVQDGRPHPWTKGEPRSGMLTAVPSGLIDILLDSETAEGSFYANRRTNIWWNWHEGGMLKFAAGRLTSHSLEEGGDWVDRQYEKGSAGKDRTSLLSLGLNPAVRDVPNLERSECGSVSLQIGGNQGLGGTNGSSFFNWFTLAGSDVSIDGTPVIRAGRLV